MKKLNVKKVRKDIICCLRIADVFRILSYILCGFAFLAFMFMAAENDSETTKQFIIREVLCLVSFAGLLVLSGYTFSISERLKKRINLLFSLLSSEKKR